MSVLVYMQESTTAGTRPAKDLMSKEALDKYITIAERLLLRRELEGPLSQDVEAKETEPLDDLWWAMTEEEQNEVESHFKRVPDAPESLELVDVEVKIGESKMPRMHLDSL